MKLSFKLMGLMTLSSTTVLAGSLDSPSAPGNASSGMYSLQAICDRLSTGAAGSPNAFTEPTSGPGATGCTLNDVMTKVPAQDNTNGAAPAEVAMGRKFWGLKSGSWGLQTGMGGSIVAVLPRTGQTLCYDDTGSSNNTIPCAGTGQDGNLQKGVAWPSPRFADNSNGTVTDNLTSLIWLKDTNCFNTAVSWTTALLYAKNLASGACGLTDGSTAGQWRLPNIRELLSLVDFSKVNPALPTNTSFNGAPNYTFWSATSDAGTASKTWVVGFSDGQVLSTGKSGANYVWPVRGGQ